MGSFILRTTETQRKEEEGCMRKDEGPTISRCFLTGTITINTIYSVNRLRYVIAYHEDID
jgi:hypothetical protein